MTKMPLISALSIPSLIKGPAAESCRENLELWRRKQFKNGEKYKDTSDSSEAQHSETASPPGHFASNLSMIGQV